MKRILLAGLLLCSISVIAQTRQNVYFLKNNGRQVATRDSADYIRVIREPDSTSVYYRLNEYYLNGKPKLNGYTSTITPVKFEEQCVTFYSNGNKSAVLNYIKGRLVGKQMRFYANGKLEEELYYPENVSDKATLFEGTHTLINYADSAGNYFVKDGNGTYKRSKTSMVKKKLNTWSTEGEVKNGLKQGAWKTSIDKDSIKLVENFDNGKFTSGTATFANGETVNYTEADKLPEFNGGTRAFNAYLSSNLRYPKEAQQQRIQGRVLVSFVIDTDGSLTDIKTTGRTPSEDLAEEALRVIRKSPKWIPGRQYGRIVKVQYTVPIVFSLAR